MKCKYCGKDLMEGAKFCVYCGKPIEEENLIQQQEVKQEDIIPTMQPIAPTETVIKEKTEEVRTNIIQNVETPISQRIEEPALQPIEEEKIGQSIVDIVATEPVQPEPTPIELPKQQIETPKQEISVETKVVKKNNPILIVIIFILLAIIIGGGIFVYTKYMVSSDNKKSNNQKQETTNEVTEQDYDKEKAKELVDKYYFTGSSPSKNLFTEEMTSSQKKSIAAKNIDQNKIQTITCEGLEGFTKDATGVCRNNDNSSITTDGKMISYEDLNKEYKYLFGENEEIEKQDFEVLLTTWKYDSDKDGFIVYNKVGGFISGPYFSTYGVQSAKVNGENLVVNVGYIYTDVEATTTIGGEEITIKEEEIQKEGFEKEFQNKYLDKLDTYKFTFKYENDHYVFVDMKKA